MTAWRRALWWAPPALYMALIYELSSRPALPAVGPDVLAHLIEYLVLGVLLVPALAREPLRPRPREAVAAWLLGGVYGLSDELHQRFVPGRHAEWKDVLVDQAGAGLGALAAWCGSRWWSREAGGGKP